MVSPGWKRPMSYQSCQVMVCHGPALLRLLLCKGRALCQAWMTLHTQCVQFSSLQHCALFGAGMCRGLSLLYEVVCSVWHSPAHRVGLLAPARSPPAGWHASSTPHRAPRSMAGWSHPAAQQSTPQGPLGPRGCLRRRWHCEGRCPGRNPHLRCRSNRSSARRRSCKPPGLCS
jgi:hypothetical protein